LARWFPIISKLPNTSKVKARLTTDFHRRVFAAVIQSFEQYDNPLRVNNFATGLRELSRLVLEYYAPEKSIKECAWYVEEKNENNKYWPEAAMPARAYSRASTMGTAVSFGSMRMAISIRRKRRSAGALMQSDLPLTPISPRQK
jgi:hypothetical protein